MWADLLPLPLPSRGPMCGRTGCVTPAVLGAHMWANWLAHPCRLGGPGALESTSFFFLALRTAPTRGEALLGSQRRANIPAGALGTLVSSLVQTPMEMLLKQRQANQSQSTGEVCSAAALCTRTVREGLNVLAVLSAQVPESTHLARTPPQSLDQAIAQ